MNPKRAGDADPILRLKPQFRSELPLDAMSLASWDIEQLEALSDFSEVIRLGHDDETEARRSQDPRKFVSVPRREDVHDDGGGPITDVQAVVNVHHARSRSSP